MRCTVCNSDNSEAAAACRSCGSPLAVEAPAASEQVLPVGTVLQGGAFVIDRVLGQGGFGITYEGRDTTLNRTVAIKEFFPQAQGCVRRGTTVHPSGGITSVKFQEERTSFLKEGERLAQFQHTGIVRVFSLFEQNNTAYMVMEFLNGKTLLKMVEETGPLDERSVVPLVEQVASALEVVHKKNVIHRDIKPENIVVTRDQRVVLIDFGTAREFAVEKTRRMTMLLTPGYAPLEQYGQHARFGAFTDIYALGATTYFLLTGQVPIQPTDRASGVELAAPRRLNSSISSQVSDAIMWAMEMRVDKRPQSASEFVQAVRGTRSPSSNGSTTGSTPSPQTAPNAHDARILQLIAELESSPTPPQTYDKRINEISSMLSRITASGHSPVDHCPFCSRPTLEQLEGTRFSNCPVCLARRLELKNLDQDLCAVCRAGHISLTKRRPQWMVCPICRSRSLGGEKRKLFGLHIDKWWVCPGCGAEFHVLIGGRAKLVSVKRDCLGEGKALEGQTLPIAAWRQLAPPSKACWSCDQCNAVFLELDGSRLALDWVEDDPLGQKEKLLGKAFYRTVWAKLANGLDPKEGNAYCPACSATFDLDRVDKKLKLLGCNREKFPAAASVEGKFHSLESWSLFVAGKKSLAPGWLCSGCGAEFDSEDGAMKLVGGPPNYSKCVGETRSLEDWHRLLRNLPSEQEEDQLKKELTKLQVQKQEELARFDKAEIKRKEALSSQLHNLVKESVIAGLFPVELPTKEFPLKRDEWIVWAGVSLKLKQRRLDGVPYWDLAEDGSGVLVLTSQRLVFLSETGSKWSKHLTGFIGVDHERDKDLGELVVCSLDNQLKPIAFRVPEAPVTYSIGGRDFPFTLTPHDFTEMLRSRMLA